ncbi:daptide-type RiPP [Paenibacillus albicereus]|nr:daptide-type RiPP [Paenibacillus albicereus]
MKNLSLQLEELEGVTAPDWQDVAIGIGIGIGIGAIAFT